MSCLAWGRSVQFFKWVRTFARLSGTLALAIQLIALASGSAWAQSHSKKRSSSSHKNSKSTQANHLIEPAITIVEPIKDLPDLNALLKRTTAPPAPICMIDVPQPNPQAMNPRNNDWIFQGVSVSNFNDNFPNFFGFSQGKQSPENWISGDDFGHTFGLSASIRAVIPDAVHETDWLVISGVTTDNYSENLYRVHQREDGRFIADQRAVALTRIFLVARTSKWDQTKPYFFEQVGLEAGIRNPTDSLSWDANGIQEWFHERVLTRASIPKTIANLNEGITPFFSALTGLGFFIPLSPSTASKWGDISTIPQSAFATLQTGFKINSSGTSESPLASSNVYVLGTVSLPLGKNFSIEAANYIRFYPKGFNDRTVAAVRGDASVTLTYSGLPVDLGLAYTRPYGEIDAEKSLLLNEGPSSKMRFTIGVPLTPAFELITH